MRLALPLLAIVVGCGEAPDYRDQRLVELAQQSTAEQRKQNDRIADQSQAVVEESHQLAEAAKDLVERDAEARRELIAAQAASDIAAQRSASNDSRGPPSNSNKIDANWRSSATAIRSSPPRLQSVGLAIACLLPLARRGVRDLANARPRTGSRRRRRTAHAGAHQRRTALATQAQLNTAGLEPSRLGRNPSFAAPTTRPR